MSNNIIENLEWIEKRIEGSHPAQKVGRVVEVTGLVIESEGPEVSLGDVVDIYTRGSKEGVSAEVVGFRDSRVLLMSLREISGIHPGCRVVASVKAKNYPVGEGLIGRVIDGLGRPIDGEGMLQANFVSDLNAEPVNPMTRGRIKDIFGTGVRVIDIFTPLGCGQRMGIYAGSGVGKSSLLGMIARGSEAEVNVIALVGERGRELKEFIDCDLGEGLKKSVIVISTSDQPAPLRVRAALLATRIAEYFRQKNKKVMLMMDSLTRFAMAQREIGLAIGEPPTARGYTPSVFSMLSRLIERSGISDEGSITALYTVLVEGDDMNEPISDASRALLDGHILLDRGLATANHFPAVDVLGSVSRLMRQICRRDHQSLANQARDLLAIYKKNEDLINIGAYKKGANPRIDHAIEIYGRMTDLLKQPLETLVPLKESYEALKFILK